MVRRCARFFIEKIKNKLNSQRFMIDNRVSNSDFTRKRKLPFTSVVCFLLNSVKQTLQKELTSFINIISNYENVSKSAFCQQRVKLKPEAFIELNELLIDEFYTDNEYETWESFRLLGIDGSTLELPRSEDILATFGSDNNVGNIPMSRISTFYDLLNTLIVDSKIVPYDNDELTVALEHLKKVQKKDLILYDRGYGAMWLFFYMTLNKINYVVRLKNNFSIQTEDFVKSNENSRIIEIKDCSTKSKNRLKKLNLSFQPFKLRLIKVPLDSNEIEILATSLLDEEKYSHKIFKELYFKRWGIEVNYDHLKNHIEIGNFTGLSSTVIKQDFYANALIANIQSIIIRDAQEELKKEKKDTEYEYKINKNLSLSYMKNRLIQILTSNNPEYLEELKKLFKIEPVPIRPNRKFSRKENLPNKKFYINKKSAV